MLCTPQLQPRSAVQLKHAAVPQLSLAPPARRRVSRCRWAPDSKDDATETHSTSNSSTSDPKKSRQLINQLLQIQSLSSLQSMRSVDSSHARDDKLQSPVKPSATHLQQGKMPPALADQFLSSAAQDVASTPSQQAAAQPSSLFDDPAAEDYDPLVLDMLGFATIAQYLDHKVSSTGAEAKVSMAGVLLWGLMAAAMVAPLGGTSAYTDSITILTDAGLEMGNLVYLWVAILGYYTVKGCIMALVMSVRAWRLHEQQGERLEELAETVEVQEQRRAFWTLQEKMQRADDKANRTYAEFALASLLLGVLLLMTGGPDNLELQMGTLDQESFLDLLVVLWLFWEAYFATVGATVTVGNWVFAVVQRWQYQRKWGSRASGKQQ